MHSKQDFVMKNGVLIEYTGPGGDVTIPEGVAVIQDNSFFGCTGLTGVTIPEGVTVIGGGPFGGAFTDCTGLTSVTISEGVKKIEWNAFSGCTGLTSVTVPKSVEEIERAAFSGCTSLTDVTIPESVAQIGQDAFEDTPWLAGLGEFAVVNHVLLKYQGAGGDVVIPEGVTKIGERAFSGCTGLTGVTIPEGVTAIGERAFSGCTGLTGAAIPESVTEIKQNAFCGCIRLTCVGIPKSMRSIDPSVFAGCRPSLVAPHIPIADFDKKDKGGACTGFARLYLENAELDGEIRAGYLKYIRGQRKRLYSLAIRRQELLQLMFAEKMIPRRDIDLLLEKCNKQNNRAAKAAVLAYAGQNPEPSC